MQRFYKNIFLSLCAFLFIGLFFCASLYYAQAQEPPPNVNFIPLTNLPGLADDTGTRTLADYINVLYRLSIGIGALVAVIKITFAGIKYMSSSASVSSTAEAKSDITTSLFGLLIMLSTVVILQFIYPDILTLNVLQNLRPVEVILKREEWLLPPWVTPVADIFKAAFIREHPELDVIKTASLRIASAPNDTAYADAKKIFQDNCAQRHGSTYSKEVTNTFGSRLGENLFCGTDRIIQ